MWLEFVGIYGDDVVLVIKRENLSFNVFVFLIGSIVIVDLRENWVRVWVDINCIVVRVFIIG